MAGNRNGRGILEYQCCDVEAERVWREAIVVGDDHAWVRLGLLLLDFDHNNDSGLEVELIDMDRADEAIRVWQQGIVEGAGGAIRIWLGRLLELCGRLGEAEQMWGHALAEDDGGAMGKLAEALELQGRHAESRAMYAACGIGIHVPNCPTGMTCLSANRQKAGCYRQYESVAR